MTRYFLQNQDSETKYRAGLDPNSEEMQNYLNASRRDGGSWKDVAAELDVFDRIISNSTNPEYERVDAKGYFLISLAKTSGYAEGRETNFQIRQEAQAKRIQKLREDGILEKHFGLTKQNISISNLYEIVEIQARRMIEEHSSNNTPYDQSVTATACAYLMRLPQGQISEEELRNFAKLHFSSLHRSSDFKNSRAFQSLGTAYEWMQNPHIPYSNWIEGSLIQKMSDKKYPKAGSIYSKDEISAYCKEARKEALEQALALGNNDVRKNLAEIAEEEGRLIKARDHLTLGAYYGSEECEKDLEEFDDKYDRDPENKIEKEEAEKCISAELSIEGKAGHQVRKNIEKGTEGNLAETKQNIAESKEKESKKTEEKRPEYMANNDLHSEKISSLQTNEIRDDINIGSTENQKKSSNSEEKSSEKSKEKTFAERYQESKKPDKFFER